MILHMFIAMVAGWLQRHQQQAIAYLLAENRVLKASLGGRRLRDAGASCSPRGAAV
jgi:hypothetical protein